MNKHFYKFSFATFLSLLGDQLTLVAFPWLLMKLSNEPWIIGIALGLIGLPRALAILAGGVLTDRYDTRTLLITSRLASGVIMSIMVALLALDTLSLPIFILLAFFLGLTSALGMPATPTFIGSLLGEDEAKVKAGNGVILGIAQIAGLLGPIIAGFLLSYFSNTDLTLSFDGFIIIFVVDMLTFFLAAITIYQIKTQASGNKAQESFKKSFFEGLTFLRERKFLIILFSYLALINFVVHGSVLVGLPILVKEHMGATPQLYGSLMTVCGLGALFAFGSAKLVPSIPLDKYFTILALIDLVTAGLIYSFVSVEFGWLSFVILFSIGFIGGLIQLNTFSLLQTKVEEHFRGRMISFFMFSVFGLIPISSSITGWVVGVTGVIGAFKFMAVLLALVAVFFLLITSKYKTSLTLQQDQVSG